ncbi:insulinase family protein [Sansalvadorimonas sp. 2012CJ34-2]|uniref:Insulinase family protein n=1 Tax=Parendozoicomonas callyspongiae TaxID=2942213 RepID=A0ABT0PL76_9GAMM|nr:pitrilysin family protein [Sansalvadorimonas sp. 2012CJ34-2]MCL6272140.1 insulinase family protein [Sansalvadorimonas sp. 2012CJ34-2]
MTDRPRFRKRILALVLSGAFLAGCSGMSVSSFTASSQTTASQPAALPEVTIPFQKFTLDNGLTVIVNEDHKAPIVAVNIWYKVGSKDESLGSRGFAHLFEHLMFQGSENFQGEFFTPFKEAGATDQNGTTSSDRTNYFQTVPTPALDMALWMESDRMGHFLNSISQAKLDEQRGVVKNEKRQGEDRPYGKVWSRVAEQSFPDGHPYSWPTIGYMEDLDAASVDLVKKWFETYYGPSNAVLVLSGDIDVETAREKVQKYFGDIPAGEPLNKLEAWVAKRSEDKRDTIQDRVPQTRIMMVWNVAESGTEDAELLSLASDVLGGGRNSRLYKRLVLEDQLATDVSVFLYDRLLAGQFMISASARPDVTTDQLETAIREELASFLKDGPTKEELQRIRFSQAAGFVRGTERVGGFGGKSDILARGEVLHGDPAFYQKSLDMMKASTPAAIRTSAKEWLSDGAYVLEVTPFPEYSHSAQGADRSRVPAAGDQVDLSLPALEKATLDNGLSVVLASRPQTPVVQMELLFNGGLSGRLGKPGLPDLAMAMLTEGTKKRSNLQLAADLENIGTGLSTGNDLDTSSVYLNTLTVSLDPSLNILADVLMNPVFPEKNFVRVRNNLLDGIRQEKATPTSAVGRVLPELLYGNDHAYNTPWSGNGTTESVKELQREDLIEFWKTWLRPDNATLIVTGDITMEQLLPKLNKAFVKWNAPQLPLPNKNIAHVDAPEKTRVYLVDYPGSSQSVIVASQLVMPSNNDNTLAFNLMNDVIGGQFTARLNMNLREDKSWAYGAKSYAKSARGQRPYLASASVQADKTSPAVQEILKEYHAFLSSKPATAQEVDFVKRNRIRKLPGSYETNGALLSSISSLVEYDLPENDLYEYADKVEGVSTHDIQAMAKEYLTPDAFTWVIAGDVKKIKPELEKLGLGEIVVLNKDGRPSN